MLDIQLGPVRQNFTQLRKRARDEIRFRFVMAGEWMRPHDDPVDVIRHVLEERSAVAMLQSAEDLANEISLDCHVGASLSVKYDPAGDDHQRESRLSRSSTLPASGSPPACRLASNLRCRRPSRSRRCN